MSKCWHVFLVVLGAFLFVSKFAFADVCLSAGGDCPVVPMSALGGDPGLGVPALLPVGRAPNYSSTLQQSMRAPGNVNGQPAQVFAVSTTKPDGSCEAPETELQRYLCQTTNHYLPVYGMNMFGRGGNSFVQQDAVAVAPDYPIGVGDSFSVRIWGQLDADLQLTVDSSGMIFIPRVGAISVVGVPFGALKPYLVHAIAGVFRNFDLAVTMGQLKAVQVFVVGFVRQPGSVSLNSLSTIVNALYAAGGPSASGSLRHVQLKRGNKVVQEFDLYDLLLRGDKSKDVLLQAGDVVYVPAVGPQVAIRGAIRIPAIYEIKDRDTLQQLIKLAGDPVDSVLSGNVSIERIKENKERVIESTALSNAANYSLQAGDIVQMYKLSNRVNQFVSLRGNVAQPVRQAWRDGMHISDLIVSRDMLLAPEFWNTRYRRNAESALGGEEKIRRTLTTDDDEINWDYAAIERLDPVSLTTKLVPFNLAKAISKDTTQNLQLQAGDTIHVFSKADIHVSGLNQTRYVRIEGEVAVPGIYEVQQGETLEHLIARLGGITSRAYLYAAQFNREAVRQKQQSELDYMLDGLSVEAQRQSADTIANSLNQNASLISGEEAANQKLFAKLRGQKATGRVVLGVPPDAKDINVLPELELENGDSLYIPPRPATIAIVGAVYNRDTAFIYDRRKSIGDYLQLAGGPTRNADDNEIYVVRADGSILSESQGGLFSSVTRLAALPGDTIIVPEKLDRTSFVRSMLNWTQILANFATGAAAIKILGN